uniref:Zinc transporter ZitB n=1 Tax=Candidatus Methanophagaceae archaeon ANME-1 ERB6 TaxID=2759912 RepID=A0A7G9YZL6_9EURY|nr:zinc transporter ZitB [Methanosarcinales archaeon ANME-1 ERB6]
MGLKIRDYQVKKNIRWHILRLLRLGSRTRQELIDKLSDMYLGYWQVNNELIARNLSQLESEGLISCGDNYDHEITERGLEDLDNKEKALEEYDTKYISKEGCAKHSLWANVGLSALEFVIGFISGSIGLIADAVHTAVDILASAVTWIGIRIDKETQAVFLGGIILCGIGFFIGFGSLRNVLRGVEISFQLVALITIAINITINGFFSFYKFYVGGRTRSISLVADAYHTKTDIWSSVAVFVGLLGATFGFFTLDSIAGAVVSIFIFFGGYELIHESRKLKQGEDPKLEKFSRFIKLHLKKLTYNGVWISLWLLNLQEMTKEEHLNCLKRGFGRRFPVMLEEDDYDRIYSILEGEGLVENIGGKLKISEKGSEELKAKAIPPDVPSVIRRFWFTRRIGYNAEGL